MQIGDFNLEHLPEGYNKKSRNIIILPLLAKTCNSKSYTAPFRPFVCGKTFKVDQDVLESLHFPHKQSDLIIINEGTALDFVFVTAASSQFYEGLYSAILTVRQYMPTYKIIVYDLGLLSKQVKKVINLLPGLKLQRQHIIYFILNKITKQSMIKWNIQFIIEQVKE